MESGSLNHTLQHVHESIVIVHSLIIDLAVQVVQFQVGHEGLHVISLAGVLLLLSKHGFLHHFLGVQVVEDLSSKGHDHVLFSLLGSFALLLGVELAWGVHLRSHRAGEGRHKASGSLEVELGHWLGSNRWSVLGTGKGGSGAVVMVVVGRSTFGSNPRHIPEVGLGGGVGTGTDTGSLHLGSLDLVGQCGLSTEEVFVVVSVLVSSTGESLESIKVELALEAAHLGELEVPGKQLLELLWLSDDEASSVLLPSNDIGVSVGFHLIQHLVKTNGEWSGDTASCWAVLDVLVLVGVVMVVVLHDNVRVMFPVGAGRRSNVVALDFGGLHQTHGSCVDGRLDLVV